MWRRSRGPARCDRLRAEDDLNPNSHRNKSRAIALATTAEAAARARFAVKLAIAAALTILTLVWAQQAFARSAPESFADLAAQALPAVVNVSSTQKVPQDQQMQDLDEMFRSEEHTSELQSP